MCRAMRCSRTSATAGSTASSGRSGGTQKSRSPRLRLRSMRTLRQGIYARLKTLRGESTQALARGAEPVDAQLDHIPVDQKARRLLPEADAGGSAGGDDVARQERHELADVADERRHVIDEVLGRAGLLGLPVHFEPQAQVVDVGDLVGRREIGTEGREGVAALPLDPLPPTLELEGSLRVVVVQYVARHVGQGGVPLDVARAAPDDHRKLHLPVGLRAAPGDDDVVVRTAERGRRFEEQHGLGRDRLARLLRVVAIVETDAHDLAGSHERWSEPHAVRHGGGAGPFLREPARQALEAAGAEERLVVIGAESRDVNAPPSVHNQAGPFPPRFTESNEFHRSPSPSHNPCRYVAPNARSYKP